MMPVSRLYSYALPAQVFGRRVTQAEFDQYQPKLLDPLYLSSSGSHFDLEDEYFLHALDQQSMFIRQRPQKDFSLKYHLEGLMDRIQAKTRRLLDRLRGKKSSVSIYLTVFKNNTKELYAPGFEKADKLLEKKSDRFEKFFALSPLRAKHLMNHLYQERKNDMSKETGERINNRKQAEKNYMKDHAFRFGFLRKTSLFEGGNDILVKVRGYGHSQDYTQWLEQQEINETPDE